MSWTAIATAVTGDIIPASFWNQQIVANLAQNETFVIAALGNFPYATAANTVSATTTGFTKFSVLGVAPTGTPNYISSGCVAYIYTTSAQTLGASTNDIVLTFDTEFFDTDNMSNLGSNNERLTCVTAGLFLVMGGVGVFSAVSNFALRLAKYNSSNVLQDIYANTSGYVTDGMNVTALISFAIGDYVKLIIDNSLGSSSSSNTSTTDDIASKFLSMKKVCS